ncbi:MAG: hypothetical protein AAF990_09735 [Bacteroidota bacterium]
MIFTFGCQQPPQSERTPTPGQPAVKDTVDVKTTALEGGPMKRLLPVKGALLSTRFKSLEELKEVVQIEYDKGGAPSVRLTHRSEGRQVVSVLKTGISEKEIKRAKDGSLWDKVRLGLRAPYIAIKRHDLMRILLLARRRGYLFGEGDAAFYDLSEEILYNISDEDIAHMHSEDLSEKGYFNAFNHITAQAFMTSIFSEKMADFIAHTHERGTMPELITGAFTNDQLEDLEYGPIDNYVDIINNEWGQELGKQLSEKYQIDRYTHWTAELLANYLNDIQRYYSWAFQIGFQPFTTQDEVVQKFSKKINRIMTDESLLR